jgi:hypothetical protein
VTLSELRAQPTMPESAIIFLGPEQREVLGADAARTAAANTAATGAASAVAGGAARVATGGGGAGAGRGGRGGGGAGAAGAATRSEVVATGRPALAWARTSADSILVRWPLAGQEIVLRLRLTPTGIAGTAVASSEVDPPRFATVTGTTVSCARD